MPTSPAYFFLSPHHFCVSSITDRAVSRSLLRSRDSSIRPRAFLSAMISAPQAPAAAGFGPPSPCSSRRTVRCAVAVASAAPSGRCTLYEVLGLRAGATGGEIKAAYRRLALERHPDVAGAAGDDFIRLHDAYATLSDPDARARYDRDLVAQAYAQPPASRPAPHSFWGRPRRTWETDQCW